MSKPKKPPTPELDPASEQLLKELQQGLQPGEDPFYWDIRRNWKQIASNGTAGNGASGGASIPKPWPDTDADQTKPQIDIRRLETQSIPLRTSDLRKIQRYNRRTILIAVGASLALAVPVAYWFLRAQSGIGTGQSAAATACAQPRVVEVPPAQPSQPSPTALPSTAETKEIAAPSTEPSTRKEPQRPASHASRAMQAPAPNSAPALQPGRPASSQEPAGQTRFHDTME